MQGNDSPASDSNFLVIRLDQIFCQFEPLDGSFLHHIQEPKYEPRTDSTTYREYSYNFSYPNHDQDTPVLWMLALQNHSKIVLFHSLYCLMKLPSIIYMLTVTLAGRFVIFTSICKLVGSIGTACIVSGFGTTCISAKCTNCISVCSSNCLCF